MGEHIITVSAEPSGDRLALALLEAVSHIRSDIKLTPIGSVILEAEGYESPVHMAGLDVIGLMEGLKVLPLARRKVREVGGFILKQNPDQVVLIDSWGFMIRLAIYLRKNGFLGKIVKYVAPQVWAMRDGRAKVLARHVDHLLTLHDFEAPYFEKHGLDVTYIGNPVFDTNFMSGDGQALKKKLKIKAHAPVLIVLFGSRPSEIKRLTEPFLDTLHALKSQFPNLAIISPISDAISGHFLSEFHKYERVDGFYILDEAEKFDAFAAADIALACSGTVTTQLACAAVPTVIAYKVSPLTYHLARWIYKLGHISIVNISAGKTLMPEFIQGDVRADVLGAKLSAYLEDENARHLAAQALVAQTDKMRAIVLSPDDDAPQNHSSKGADSSKSASPLKSAKRAARALIDLL